VKRPSGRRLALAGLVLLVGIQFVPVSRTNPPIQTALDTPPEVDEVLRRACFDCHSNETRWPWYSRVAPVSWLVASDVAKARGEVNFSEWPMFEREEQEHSFKDIVEQVGEGKMPLWNYIMMHPEARLDAADRETLVKWAKQEAALVGGGSDWVGE
jgi:hypothetical protein